MRHQISKLRVIASVANSPIRFVDKDENKSAVDGDVAIMLYLDAVYGQNDAAQFCKADLAKRFSRFQQAHKSAELWKRRDQVYRSDKSIGVGHVGRVCDKRSIHVQYEHTPCIVDFTLACPTCSREKMWLGRHGRVDVPEEIL